MATKFKSKHKRALARRPVNGTVAPVEPGTMGVLQRLAQDPKLTVDKFERLIAANERIQDRQARIDFNAAYDAMVMDIPVISKRGIIKNKHGELQSRYAKFEDIMRVVKPILKRHGFTLRYRTECHEGSLEVVGILTHSGGHFEESRFRSKADESGGKNAIQGLGSANSYGKRYTVTDLLNIVTEGQDDDGQKTSARPEAKKPAPPEPAHVHHKDSDQPITESQLRTLLAAAKNSSRPNEEIGGWLKARYGYTSAKLIRRKHFDEIVAAIESPKKLPTREPGED